eukprot:scaffold5368_cov206-Alexandrium_tamarense.AAC.12
MASQANVELSLWSPILFRLALLAISFEQRSLSHIRAEKDTEKGIEAVVEFLYPHYDKTKTSLC